MLLLRYYIPKDICSLIIAVSFHLLISIYTTDNSLRVTSYYDNWFAQTLPSFTEASNSNNPHPHSVSYVPQDLFLYLYRLVSKLLGNLLVYPLTSTDLYTWWTPIIIRQLCRRCFLLLKPLTLIHIPYRCLICHTDRLIFEPISSGFKASWGLYINRFQGFLGNYS